jgi:hypothetical protein
MRYLRSVIVANLIMMLVMLAGCSSDAPTPGTGSLPAQGVQKAKDTGKERPFPKPMDPE